jgi:hypothetical protein
MLSRPVLQGLQATVYFTELSIGIRGKLGPASGCEGCAFDHKLPDTFLVQIAYIGMPVVVFAPDGKENGVCRLPKIKRLSGVGQPKVVYRLKGIRSHKISRWMSQCGLLNKRSATHSGFTSSRVV